MFGSRARGDNRPDSDIDILVEIGPMSLWGYVGLTQFIEGRPKLDQSRRARNACASIGRSSSISALRAPTGANGMARVLAKAAS